MSMFTGARREVTPGATAPYDADDLSSNLHRQLIGYIGLFFPFLMVLFAGLRPSYGIQRWDTLTSVSAYYYSGANVVFIGMLVALGLFLLTYRGYENTYHWADRAAAIAAGVAALGVAIFPCEAPATVLKVRWWSDPIGTLHYISSALLFIMFAVFSLWLFRMSSGPGPLPPEKRMRNLVYLVCGVVIVGCIVWAGMGRPIGESIFAPESTALVAFAISWLVKGYAHRSIAAAAKRTLARVRGP